MRNQYTISEFIKTAYGLILTKLFYRRARLIRRPFYIRGKSSFEYDEGLTIGHNCRFDLLGSGTKTLFIGKNCEIGDNVHIVAHERVKIGDHCLMASKIFISDTSHGLYSNESENSAPNIPPNDRPIYRKPVYIGDNVWIGENVCILLGVTIGNGCIIGANSVVNKNIPDNSIVAGTPAKIIKSWDPELKRWIKV